MPRAKSTKDQNDPKKEPPPPVEDSAPGLKEFGVRFDNGLPPRPDAHEFTEQPW